MIALLVLIPALVLSEPYRINWEKCGIENVCFCPTNPNDPPSEATKLLKLQKATTTPPIPPELPIDQKCSKEGMQNKFFTKEIALFQFQVGGVTLGNDLPSLILYQGTDFMGCDFKSGKAELKVGNPKWTDEYKISLFEERSNFEAEYVICSIKVERATALFDQWKLFTTTMKLKTSQEITYLHDSEQKTFFAVMSADAIRCNPFLFKDLLVHQQDYVQKIINRDGDKLTCENYGNSYTMRYMHKIPGKETEKDIEHPIEELKCIESCDGCGEYLYELVKEKTDDKTATKVGSNMYVPAQHTIYCAAKMDEVCQDPTKGHCSLETDPTCPVYHKGEKDTKATLTCPGNRWVIGDKYLVLTADPLCKRDSLRGQNNAAFFATHSGSAMKIENGTRCFTTYNDCKVTSKLVLPSCDDPTKCGAIDASDKMKLKCQNPIRQMRVQLKGKGRTVNVTDLKCKLDSGLWYYDETEAVPPSSVVRCIDNTTNYVKSEAGMSDDKVDVIIYASCAGLTIFIIVLAVLVLCLISRRHKIQVKEKKEWMNMKKNEQLAECKEVLPQALLASPSNASIILDGLKIVDLLLDTGSQNSKVWDDAFKFLTRFHGAIERIDHAIWYMFSRYMYLKAKKIIETHGWRTGKHIRKETTKGLIRSVAIRLLSFSLRDPYNHETEELLCAGFRKLGFDAVDQYPHCGLLWSLMMHVRPKQRKRKTNPKQFEFRYINNAKFMETLKDIACKKKITTQIPRDEVIPRMGSIAQQAAFAYGGTPNNYVLNATMKDNWLKWEGNEEGGDVPLSFFDGMCQTMTTNPAQQLFDICSVFAEKPPDIRGQMKTVASEEKWNEHIMNGIRQMAYNGRTMDSMRMKEFFLPKEKTFDDEVGQLMVEQQHFEEAIEAVKDHLRTWFAAEIDKAELKKKPDYKIKSNVKLDNRVTANGVGNLNKDGTTPDLKSDKGVSNSASSTNSSDHAPNSPNAAALAAPAAPAAAPAKPQ